ncbi:MAG: Gfo/Idh/MocA family oxidoreductase [Ruminococcaceae bacterium]|nr:Gfo/Idh/MocA family oxidoreductase [Oscillospiraceae bacterium]
MSKIEKIRLGVVGLKRGLGSVFDIIIDDDVELVAICDKNPETLDRAKTRLKDEFGIENVAAYLDFDEFLTADTNTVVIATDAVMHVPFVIQAMDAGKNVLSEIPAVNSLEEAKALKKAVAAHPELKYMCGENDCFLGYIEAWKAMYEEGKFGDIVYAEGEYLHAQDYREYKPEDYVEGHWRTYNPAIKYCTHDLGPLLYIMNDRPVSVTCMVPEPQYNPYKPNYVQNAVMLVKTAKGAVIRIWICFGAYVGYTHNYALYGTRGMIEVDKSKSRTEAHCKARFSDEPASFSGEKIDVPITVSSFQDGKGKTHLGIDRKMMRAFFNCIENDTPSPIDVDLGIRMALAGIYAHESYLQGGAAIEIPDPEDFED